jgi:SAM-dependent methyltransferase
MNDEQMVDVANEPFDAAYRERFDAAYRQNVWKGTESFSLGPAGLAPARDELGPALVSLVEELGVTAVLDIGCGDGVWMPDLPGYIGVDVSIAALEAARKRHPERDYRLYEGGPLPSMAPEPIEPDPDEDADPSAGLVICKHLFQHMNPSEGVLLLDRIKATGATWLLATTYSKGDNDISHNIDNIHKGYRPNLMDEPFSLGRSRKMFRFAHEGPQDAKAKGALGLWKIG